MKVYRDKILRLEEYTFDDDGDIFGSILEQRKDAPDKDRFFLQFIPKEKLSAYDLSNPASLEEFRTVCCSMDSPIMLMGGYNMKPNHLTDDIRYAGIKMSDPYGKIYGSFDIRNGIITYSPFFTHFFEERDLCKFANDEYFTTATFEEVMMGQINRAEKFRLHVGNYSSLRDFMQKGEYVLETVSKEQMIEFVNNPEEGAKVFWKRYGR